MYESTIKDIEEYLRGVRASKRIDDFIESLGVKIEKPPQQDNGYDIQVAFSKSNDKYYLVCYKLNEANKKELPGKLVKGQYTFHGTLIDLCKKIEEGLGEIPYHRNPSEGLLGPGHAYVAYELYNLKDPRSYSINMYAKDLISQLYEDYINYLNKK